jgi:hypothetical protein
LNELKEYLKRELGVSDAQYQLLVDDAKTNSPLPKIKNDSESIGHLVSFLIQHDETMSQMLNMTLMRVMTLENKLKEMETNG